MSQSAFESAFGTFLDGTIARNKAIADRAMVQFIVLRLGLVIASASLPALTTIPDRIWSTGAAILVAVLAGLDTQFRWGEEWRHFRSNQTTLERMKREYEHRKAALADGRTIGDITTPDGNFDKLHHDVEELLQSESDRFFKFRVTDWKANQA